MRDEIICFIFFKSYTFHRGDQRLQTQYDYLQITDGNSNVIGIYCGKQTGKSVRVVGTVAVLEFHADGSVQGRGFELSFSFFPQSPACRSAQNNILRSPGYPSNYPNNINCVFQVLIPKNEELVVSFNDFSLENNTNCAYDYLRITDGYSNTIGTYCGNQTGKSVRVVGTVAVLIFHTDVSVQRSGFELSFLFFPRSHACRSFQNNILRSPGYPSNYPNNINCFYQVYIPLNKELVVSFNYFSLESHSLCRYDYLAIIVDKSNIIGTYCGHRTGKSVRVVGTVATLTFHTDASVQNRGFELSFSYFPQTPGNANLPPFTSLMPSRTQKVLKTTEPENGSHITDTNSNIIGTYCGNQTGKSVRVVGTVAVLIFHTDGSVQRSGFELSFSFFPISPACRSVQSNILRSPGYPRNYSNNVDCVNQVFIPLNKRPLPLRVKWVILICLGGIFTLLSISSPSFYSFGSSATSVTPKSASIPRTHSPTS
ncbi:CUB and peptidase domain-containing protein 1 [Acropora cervicornis]|uniref:CUB and peptidase domain-containing protein 1 n=1 Tax=Acropora cervicornis TaxID=6130 RepID=A0AAD9URY7_ACRCE|nr:CUB and peptidase domain-containing protein 1 [Acropora cervicornis]